MGIYMQPDQPGSKVALGDLVRELLTKFQELLSTQIELVKTELKVSSSKLAKGIVFGVGAVMLGFIFLQLLGVTLFLLMLPQVGAAASAAITTALYLVAVALCGMLMIRELRKNNDSIDV